MNNDLSELKELKDTNWQKVPDQVTIDFGKSLRNFNDTFNELEQKKSVLLSKVLTLLACLFVTLFFDSTDTKFTSFVVTFFAGIVVSFFYMLFARKNLDFASISVNEEIDNIKKAERRE